MAILFFSCEEHNVCPAAVFRWEKKSTADVKASLKNNDILQRKCSRVKRSIFVFEASKSHMFAKNECSSKVKSSINCSALLSATVDKRFWKWTNPSKIQQFLNSSRGVLLSFTVKNLTMISWQHRMQWGGRRIHRGGLTLARVLLLIIYIICWQ